MRSSKRNRRFPTRALLPTAALLGGLWSSADWQSAKGQTAKPAAPAATLQVEGSEQSKVDLSKFFGGLPPAWGVQSFEVFRASKGRPDLADGKGWTYNHHMDMAAWKGRLYVAWGQGEKDEDTWPARELYSTSADGTSWSPPQELFPQGVSTPLRAYWFHAPNGHMLVMAGLRLNHEETDEKLKGPLVVREILADHTLGPVHTLRAPTGDAAKEVKDAPSIFKESKDAGFVEACEQLLANHPFLEQQDYGNLLDPAERMAWNDPKNWPNTEADQRRGKAFGKAMSFYHRKDGGLVGISKQGFVTVSEDDGKTWSKPLIPASLVTGMAKVWGAHTADGRYALVYNPDRRLRFPLVVVGSDDGVTFSDMRVVQGEAPPQRYAGLHKNLGPQYIRGISEWANDGTVPDQALWIVYSMNKEDIWVSRIPLPVGAEAKAPTADEWATTPPGARVPGWNTYDPKWGSVTLEGSDGKSESLRIEDHDPFDHPRALRLFPKTNHATLSFEVLADQTDRGALEVDLGAPFGGSRPVRLSFASDGKLHTGDKGDLAPYTAKKWTKVSIDADCAKHKFSVSVDGKPIAEGADFEEAADSVAWISFRVVSQPNAPATRPDSAEIDKPTAPVTFHVRELRTGT